MSDKPGPQLKHQASAPMVRDFGKSSEKGKAAMAAFNKQVADLKLGDEDIANSVEDLPFMQAGPTLDVDHGAAEFELEPELDLNPPATATPTPKPQRAVAKSRAGSGPAASRKGPKISTQPDLELQLELESQRESEAQLEPGPELELEPAESARPNLEPVSEAAHPPKNRRQPTASQAVLPLELADPSEIKARAEIPAKKVAPHAPAPVATSHGPSPSPSPEPSGLFAADRITNFLAGGAIGLALTIIPAKNLAQRYEITEVQPLLNDLEGAIDHPLVVEAGLIEKPEGIAAKIHAGRDKTRRRYFGIWLLAGLPIGLGLGFAPRPRST